MARPRDHQKHIGLAVEDLLRSISKLIGAVGSTVTHSPEVKVATARVKRNATATGRKIGSAVKAAWARMTPAQRKARVAKMHAWRKKR